MFCEMFRYIRVFLPFKSPYRHIRILFLLYVLGILNGSALGKLSNTWHIGRVPPGRFEYERINGFFTPHVAKRICRNDIQCGGFTFKGSRNIKKRKTKVYFFHYVIDDTVSLTEYMKFPHWTTYITSRDFIVISGQYDTKFCNHTKILNE